MVLCQFCIRHRSFLSFCLSPSAEKGTKRGAKDLALAFVLPPITTVRSLGSAHHRRPIVLTIGLGASDQVLAKLAYIRLSPFLIARIAALLESPTWADPKKRTTVASFPVTGNIFLVWIMSRN
ncbi:hypothetical protein AAC387_Pa05g1809 [Persea americana]